MSSKSRKRKHNSNQPIEKSPTSLPPTAQLLSAIVLITELLHLTPLLSLSTRSSIDQILISTALRSGISSDVGCALHRSIVASIRFPAGVAVLPHALRILERDSTADVELVRDSAVRGLSEIEGIVHPRLPTQRGPMTSKQTANEEEMEEEGGEVDVAEDMITEETMVEEKVEQPIVQTELETPTIPTTNDKTSETSVLEAQQTTLPSFVTVSQTKQTTNSTNKLLSAKLSKPLKVVTTVKPTSAANDIFSMGAWKSVEAKDDDEEEEIPEIDMEFDSDEE